MGVFARVKKIVLGVPKAGVDAGYTPAPCDIWLSDKGLCFMSLDDHTGIKIPVVDVGAVEVAVGTPPGAGSFVSYMPLYTAAVVGDTLYILLPMWDSQNQMYRYYAPRDASMVVHVFYAIDRTGKMYAQVWDKNLENLLLDNATIYVELYIEGWVVTLFSPDNPLALIAILGVIGAVGGLAAWGWVNHAEAEKLKAKAELTQTQALAKMLDVIAKKVQEGQTDVRTAIKALQLANHATLTTVSSVSKPGSSENSWYANIIGTLTKYVLPFALPIIGLIFLIFKWRLLLDFLRSLFRR